MLGWGKAKKEYAVPTVPVEYPSGVCVVTDAGRFFINGKYRHKIVSERVFDSWSFPAVITTSEVAVSKYPIIKKLGFRDGTFIQSIEDSRVYLISKGEKRQIIDPDVMIRMNLTINEAILVSLEECNIHQTGEVLI